MVQSFLQLSRGKALQDRNVQGTVFLQDLFFPFRPHGRKNLIVDNPYQNRNKCFAQKYRQVEGKNQPQAFQPSFRDDFIQK